MTLVIPDPALTPEAGTPAEPAEVVVAVPEGRDAAATLSRRLHGVIGGAGGSSAGTAPSLTVVVAAEGRADQPDIARVLACAHECATSRGLGFVVR